MPQESASPATEATTKSTRMDVDADVENISPLDVDDFTNDMANMDMASSPFYGPGLELPVQEDYFAMRHDPSSGSDEARTPIAVAPTMSSRLGTSMGKSISRASAIGTPSIMATGALGPHDFFIHPSHFEMPTAASS